MRGLHDLVNRLRRGGFPRPIRAALPLERGERVIAHARGGVADSRGRPGYVVATDRALYLPGTDRTTAGTRVGWEHIAHAEWQRGGLYVREIAPLGEVPAEHRVSISAPYSLPETVRERVTASTVVNLHRSLDARSGVRIVGRRSPGTADEVTWMLVFDQGLDPRDPHLRARADRLLAEVRQQTGL